MKTIKICRQYNTEKPKDTKEVKYVWCKCWPALVFCTEEPPIEVL